MNTISPTASPRRPRERQLDQRDSLLRASILDTALELGVGTNNTVANWIFNPVEEVDEDADSILSPSLTYGSTATSEESSFSNSPYSRSQPGAGASHLGSSARKPFSPERVGYSPEGGLTGKDISAQRTVQFDLSATPEPRAVSPLPSPQKQSKLRKPRPGGYDSDGGYMSDSSKPKKDKKGKKKSKADGNQTEYESDGGYLSDFSSKKKKDKKSKKDKPKTTEYPGTDYESDGGYISRSFGSKKKPSKKSSAPGDPQTGDESDGAYMSEASTKKKRFFRFRKKQDSGDTSLPEIIPPVPQLPPMSLPIADRFASRSVTPNSMRTATPALSEHTLTDRMSDDFRPSNESSTSVPLGSLKSLANPFKDAESVRSPSIDVLATFHRRGVLPGQSIDGRSPGAGSPSPLSQSFAQMQLEQTASPESSQHAFKIPTVPTIALPKSKKNQSMKHTPPHISAPNTSALAARTSNTPVPLTITPPTPVALLSPHRPALPSSPADRSFSSSPSRIQGSQKSPFDPSAVQDRSADVPHTPTTFTDNLSTAPPSPLPSRSPSPNPSTQTLSRPHVLAYYDLPPPSPPPSGPLPSVPGEAPTSPFAKAQNAMLHNRDGSGSGTTEGASDRPSFSPVRKTPAQGAATMPSSPLPPPATPLYARSQTASPSLFLHRAGSTQRGREPPFPSRPVLPREESAELVRRTSVSRNGIRRPPFSADATGSYGNRPAREFEQSRLDAHWQPRSASAMDVRDHSPDKRGGRRSWSEYNEIEHDNIRSPTDTHPVVDDVISMLRAHKKDLDQTSTLVPPSEDDARSSLYFDVDDGASGQGDRYSIWSAKSRASILDGERSGNMRDRFVRRVEAMVGKERVPPVPKISTPPSGGMF
ncbi:unnamed protein product [Somion occarium]|uniref:Uncharacterized protein n=1 Tax=Somion occarium TaxID=3059160 RepID=A0ABP1D1D0_9APHY